jgi:hypothetical protein
MEFRVEKHWTHSGCLSVATGLGHRCGYVGIDRYHRLYGVAHSQESDLLKVVASGWQGITPENFFEVHGGLTFADKREEHPGLWFFGFDCAHAGDLLDESLMENQPDNLREILLNQGISGGTMWTLDMVVAECESLARQLDEVMSGPVFIVDEVEL